MDKNRNLWIDYLRSAITVLVVAGHSAEAYTTFAKFDKIVYIKSTHPIVDTQRWVGFDILVHFGDIFLMSLMFLIGGLFISKNIEKKGKLTFVKDRFFRLFVPFFLGGTLLNLVAFFPSFWIAYNSTDISTYVKNFFIVQKWPVGSAWFLWVLFVFNLLSLVFHRFFEQKKEKIDTFLSLFQNKPFRFFILFFVFTWSLLPTGPNIWTGIGPFYFQLSRILLYFGYFLLGVFIGNSDFNEHIFAKNSRLVRNWRLWVLLAFLTFAALTIIGQLKLLNRLVADGEINEVISWLISYTLTAASCVLSCLAFITVFRKHVQFRIAWWDSLSENAYLMYLIHYIFVIWIQFFLLDIDLSAFFKFLITFILSLGLSWLTSILLRRVKIIRQYL